jgi:putative transposase
MLLRIWTLLSNISFVKFGKETKPGFPKPKKRGVKDRFSIRDCAKFDVKNKTLRIEKLKTRIDMRQPIRFGGKLKQQ